MVRVYVFIFSDKDIISRFVTLQKTVKRTALIDKHTHFLTVEQYSEH